MDAKRWVLVIGGVLLVAGLVFGLMPLSSAGFDCGSGFFASGDAGSEDVFRILSGMGDQGLAASCADATSGRRAGALALAIPGAVLMLGALAGQRRPDAGR